MHIIGEATKKVSGETLSRNPQVPWREMARFRDRIVHAYFGINYEIVWSVITENIPVLLREIKKLLNEE